MYIQVLGKNNMKVVTGVVGNDIHVVANRLIELSLHARGYEVFNLGVNTYLEEFFDAVVETGAEILMISSLNGEAEGWGREVKLLKAKYKNLDKTDYFDKESEKATEMTEYAKSIMQTYQEMLLNGETTLHNKK